MRTQDQVKLLEKHLQTVSMELLERWLCGGDPYHRLTTSELIQMVPTQFSGPHGLNLFLDAAPAICREILVRHK